MGFSGTLSGTLFLKCCSDASHFMPGIYFPQRLSFAKRTYLGSYLPSDTVLTAPTINSLGIFFIALN